MIGGYFQINSTAMENKATRQMEQMKPQSLQPHLPPGGWQTVPFHRGDDVIRQNIETEPSGVGEEPFARQNPRGQVILKDIEDFLYRTTAFSLPTQKSLSLPIPQVGDDRKVVIAMTIVEELGLLGTKANGQVPIGLHSSLA